MEIYRIRLQLHLTSFCQNFIDAFQFHNTKDTRERERRRVSLQKFSRHFYATLIKGIISKVLEDRERGR